MTVSIGRGDGGVDEYMRFGDAYIKNGDGTLDVVRTGTSHVVSYHADEWTTVEGDEKRSRVRFPRWTRRH